MYRVQGITDKTAIGLSALCLVHCLAVPLLLLVFPSVALAFFTHELFHQALLFGIVPLSFIALFYGFRLHQNMSVVAAISIGLMFLLAAVLIDHHALEAILGHYGEAILTVIGSVTLAIGHVRNSRFSHQAKLALALKQEQGACS